MDVTRLATGEKVVGVSAGAHQSFRRRDRGCAFTAVCVALLVGLSSCGGSGESDEAKVTETVNAFFAALGDADGERACAQLTDEGLENFLLFARRDPLLHKAAVKSGACEQTVEAVVPADQAILDLSRAEVHDVVVSGDTATTRLTDRLGPARGPGLERVDGKWKVATVFPGLEATVRQEQREGRQYRRARELAGENPLPGDPCSPGLPPPPGLTCEEYTFP